MKHGSDKEEERRKKLKEKRKSKAFQEGDIDKLMETFIGNVPYWQDPEEKLLKKVEKEIDNLPAGPLPKNPFTLAFEEIVEKILAGHKAVFDEVNGRFTAKIDGKTYDLSEILEKFDSRQIILSSDYNCTQYLRFLENQARQQPAKPLTEGGGVPSQRWYDERRVGGLRDLRTAEMAAINIYTNDYYKQMNAILRGVPHKDFKHSNPHFQKNMREVLLHIGMTESGLNKMPDVTVKKTFRYEDNNLPKSIIDQRLDSIESDRNNPVVTFERGFVSTAKNKPTTSFSGKYRTTFVNVSTKDVSKISAFPHERECVMNPTQMKWIYHNTYGKHQYFLAAPVNTPLGLEPAQLNQAKTSYHESQDKMIEKLFADFSKELDSYYTHIKKLKTKHEEQRKKYGTQPPIPVERQYKQFFRIDIVFDTVMKNKWLTPKQKLDQLILVLDQVYDEVVADEKKYLYSSSLKNVIENFYDDYDANTKKLKKQHSGPEPSAHQHHYSPKEKEKEKEKYYDYDETDLSVPPIPNHDWDVNPPSPKGKHAKHYEADDLSKPPPPPPHHKTAPYSDKPHYDAHKEYAKKTPYGAGPPAHHVKEHHPYGAGPPPHAKGYHPYGAGHPPHAKGHHPYGAGPPPHAKGHHPYGAGPPPHAKGHHPYGAGPPPKGYYPYGAGPSPLATGHHSPYGAIPHAKGPYPSNVNYIAQNKSTGKAYNHYEKPHVYPKNK